jgi:hypothetical protein
MVGSNGALHKRSPVDRALKTPNQPVFAAKPRVVWPVKEARPDPIAVEGSCLTLADLPECGDTSALFDKLKAEPKVVLMAVQADIKYQKERAKQSLKLVKEPTRKQAKAALKAERIQAAERRAALDGKPLGPDFIIHTMTFGELTVGELLDNPDRYEEAKCRDPLEPDYRGGAQTAILYLKGRTPMCVSVAHGQSVKYFLRAKMPFDPGTFVGGLTGEVLPALPEPAEVMPDDYDELAAEDADEQLDGRVNNFMVRGGKVALKYEAGLGKSLKVARAVARSQNGYYLILSPSTKKSREAMEDYTEAGGTDGYVYLGRTQPDPNSAGQTMCTRPHHMTHNLNFAEQGTPLCKDCPLRGKKLCGYDKQRDHIEKTQPRVVFASHNLACYPISGWVPDKVIIDESIRNGGVNLEISVSVFDIAVRGMSMEPTKAEAKERLDAHMTSTAGGSSFADRLVHRYTELVLTALVEGRQTVRYDGKICVPRKPEYLYKDCDTLVIDASLDRLLTELFIGPLDEFFESRVKMNHHLTQVLGHKMGIKSILGSSDLQRTILDITDGYGGKFVSKSVRERLGKMDDPSWGHFQNVRGLNVWAHADSLIIIGYCQPPISEMVAIAQVLVGGKIEGKEFEETVYIKTRARASRKKYPTKVNNHTDEIVQALIRASRDEELYQVIMRARQIWHVGPPKRVVLVSPVATKLLVDEVIEWKDFKNGRVRGRLEQALFEENGEMCISAAELGKKYPELYTSTQTVMRDYREAKTGGNPFVEFLGPGPRGVPILRLRDYFQSGGFRKKSIS